MREAGKVSVKKHAVKKSEHRHKVQFVVRCKLMQSWVSVQTDGSCDSLTQSFLKLQANGHGMILFSFQQLKIKQILPRSCLAKLR